MSQPRFVADLYAADGDSLFRIDGAGVATTLGTGFNEINDLTFGADGALSLSEFGADWVVRIASVPEPSDGLMAGVAVTVLAAWRASAEGRCSAIPPAA